MRPIDIDEHKGKFFSILGQTDLSQIGVMTLKSGGDSGPEDIHPGDQVIYVIEGKAKVEIGQDSLEVSPGMLLTIPKQTRHHIYNTGKTDLFLLSIYAPPAY